ncbi:MAG: amidohydrolase [Candidatus Zixiibacteriota bacterium]
MKAKSLIYNARIYTQADDLTVDSMVLKGNLIEAVGHHLHQSGEFRGYAKINLKGKTVLPGFVDAHTHFYFFALSLGRVSLVGLDSLEVCLKKIKHFAQDLKRDEWVVGEGYSPDRFRKRTEPNRYMLDKVTGGRPAFLFSKDQHTAWVNSKGLEIAGISKSTPQPTGGEIVRFEDGTPTGILREAPAYGKVYGCIPHPSKKEVDQRWRLALEHAYKKGVTGVHSFDGPQAFAYISQLAEKNAVGLRINYYPPAELLPQLLKTKTTYGTGTEFFRIAGIKVYADGSLGSQTALCFEQYLGSKGNFGIEVTTVREMRRLIQSAAKLGLPCAIHAIGDKAVSNVLDALERSSPLTSGARHRIEHLQLVRRKDLAQVKRLKVVASMQPSHCPSDIEHVHKYWGRRGANAYLFRTIIDNGIDLAFGSDAPIEPLDPISGIAAAVRRAKPGSRNVFYPSERITAREAIYHFTVGPAIASGEGHRRGRLLPGYPADFVILSDDPTRISPSRIYDIEVLATVLGGQVRYCHDLIRL